MKVVFCMLTILAITLLTVSSIAAPSQAARKTIFAVITDSHSTIPAPDDWVLTGTAFDLEKRLGRLSGLEAADRLAVASTMHNAKVRDRASVVRHIMEQCGSAIVICLAGSIENSTLSLRADLYKSSKSPTVSFVKSGPKENLFALVGELAQMIVCELTKSSINVGAVQGTPDLKWTPCGSVAVYENLIRGMTLLQSGHLGEAQNRLSQVLSAEPDNWFAHYFVGAVGLYKGDISQAALYCRKAISLNPDVYAGVYANLSYCCKAMGDNKEAQWAKVEFERRTGKALPVRTVPGAMPSASSYAGKP